ncbi:hypothetical protein EUAN_05100 [Andreesenia angusta]|uniref:SHOCT domain-containing protein n=1 Tax=Andreesenia angusta TaxID=39480 RepID=A0A1S1V7Y6_9FIRM|nr:SHOCT domain-containing protein [Andreesenia angusta]OHW62726.1 hypothetical protein EUAN_05100 [Andreesenia angusta]
MMLNRFGRGGFGDYGCPFVDSFGRGGYFMMAGVVVLVIALVAVLVLLDRRRKLEDNALEILKERLANGEINEEEYERKRKLLK